MELCKIKDDFLKILRVCLSMSRSYYLTQVKTMREDRKIQARGRPTHILHTRTVPLNGREILVNCFLVHKYIGSSFSPLKEARNAEAETSMVVKSMIVKQEKVSDMPPEIQYQVS